MTTTTDDDTEMTEEVKKPAKEIPIVHDEGFFVHSTGDMYDGFFEAKKKDKVAKMHGPGKYTTAEGDTYIGNWEADRLVGDDTTVTFNDGSRYVGVFKDWCYAGQGRYSFPDESVITCNFVENSPNGAMVLTDPNGHLWLGKAEQGFGWFEPVNHFYQMLERTRESRIRKNRPKDNV